MLVAPLVLGDGARTGAGAVVTKDVPAGMLALGVPARLRKPREAATPEPEAVREPEPEAAPAVPAAAEASNRDKR
jgi:serine acetyltransferase